MKKQLSYANAKHIAFVALAGDDEIAQNKITLKNMLTGEQKVVSPEDILEEIKYSS